MNDECEIRGINWIAVAIVVIFICMVAVGAAEIMNRLQCAGYLGGVDCCRMPR